MKIAIFGGTFSPDFNKYIKDLFRYLNLNRIGVFLYKPFYDFVSDECKINPDFDGVFTDTESVPEDIDFLISIGGDGTFLKSIMFLKSFKIPVIGINSGRLGFLANISKEELSEALDAILKGNYKLENRSMLSVESENQIFGQYNFALNDVTIQKKDTVMITIDTYLNNEFLNTYWTDGLIISTPTGSTAYNMSVGGPIVLPGSDNLVIAPIASHNLTVRPIIVPDNIEIRLEVKSRSGNFHITLDNRTEIMDVKDNIFRIKKAKFPLKIVNFSFNSFYYTIRNKLMWGADKRN
ncbi:MAG: NAD kinase [Bacteroidales bacterium]|nr:NAD kinase [Bacteroidales bacterium]